MKIPSKYSENQILLALKLVSGIGEVTIRKVSSGKKGLDFRYLTKDQRSKVNSFRWSKLEDLLKELKNKKIDYLTVLEEGYPKDLKEIADYPPVIFLKGNLELLYQPCFSVVGTRKMTAYGRSCVEKFIPEFVDKNWVIVSGMAFGVDYYSHKMTLDNDGLTIAVLASGVDIPSPATNAPLYNRILENRGLIVSELLPGTKPAAGFFPRRNRIISGLSKGVLVVEAGEKSGSLITAYSAFDQNREVFAIPGNLGKKSSLGTNKIIKGDVAKLVSCAEDIFLDFGYLDCAKKEIKKNLDFNSEEEKFIYNLLVKKGSLSADEIGVELKMDIAKLSNILTMMELEGILTSVDSKYGVSL